MSDRIAEEVAVVRAAALDGTGPIEQIVTERFDRVLKPWVAEVCMLREELARLRLEQEQEKRETVLSVMGQLDKKSLELQQTVKKKCLELNPRLKTNRVLYVSGRVVDALNCKRRRDGETYDEILVRLLQIPP